MTTGTKNTLINTVTRQVKSGESVKAGYWVMDEGDGIEHVDDLKKVFGLNHHDRAAGKDATVSPTGSPGVYNTVADGAISKGDDITAVIASGGGAVQGRSKAAATGEVVLGNADHDAAKGQILSFTMRSLPANKA